MKRIAVFGTGYVGCVTGACLARDGHRVIGVDVDSEKVALLNSGEAPLSEPGLSELISAQVEAGRMQATLDVAAAVRNTDMAMVCVGTPSRGDGSVSTEAVERVMKALGEALRAHPHPYTVVLRSTLLPGILEERLAPILVRAARRELGPDFVLCNHPEFLRESTAIRDYDAPPFIVVGAYEEGDVSAVLDLYPAISAERIVTDSRTAALLKYSCNAYHALKVAFANEVGSLARSLGADGLEVMRLVCQDTKLNVSAAYLRPGFAFGGSCLPKDVRALVRHAEQDALQIDLMRSILPSNQSHLARAIQAVERSGHRRIGLVGLSFKAGTDDLRESPMVAFVETLLGRGFRIKIYDPDVRLSQLRGRNQAYVDQHLPHLADLLVDSVEEVYDHSTLLVFGNDTADKLAWRKKYTGEVYDLRTALVRPSAVPAAPLRVAA